MINSVEIWIPIYKAENSVEFVVKELSEFTWEPNVQFYFVDNCSPDKTVDKTITSIKKHYFSNAKVVKNSVNVGLGGTQKLHSITLRKVAANR